MFETELFYLKATLYAVIIQGVSKMLRRISEMSSPRENKNRKFISVHVGKEFLRYSPHVQPTSVF